MRIGDVIQLIEDGAKVARKGWNGKGMFIYYVPSAQYPAMTDVAKKEFGTHVSYQAYIAMKTADGTVVPWLASQSDLLASDWEVVED